jgi:histidine ammonia-lyase
MEQRAEGMLWRAAQLRRQAKNFENDGLTALAAITLWSATKLQRRAERLMALYFEVESTETQPIAEPIGQHRAMA